MKKKIKYIALSSLLTSLTVVSIATLSSFTQEKQNELVQKDFQAKVNNSITNLGTLNVINKQIDLLLNLTDPDFWNAFKNYFPNDFKGIANDTTNLQYFFKCLIWYKDQGAINPLFLTQLNFLDFYNNYSQLGSSEKTIDDVISFEYDDVKNNALTMVNGQVYLKSKIGRNIQNIFKFSELSPSQSELDFSISNLKKQYDIYMRNEALGKNGWNSTNVADDAIVNPFKIEAAKNDTLISANLTSNPNIEKFLIDNLIQYENNNGQAIEANANTDAILATNLSKADFIKNKIIKFIDAKPFVGSGKIKITIEFNTTGSINQENRNVWLNSKKKSLMDSRGTFSQMEIGANVIKTFWLSGWKKDFSFSKVQDALTNFLILDSSQIIVDDKILNTFKSKELQKLVANKEYDLLFKSIIAFDAYNAKSEKEFANKLIATNLSFDEFKTLNKNHPFIFIDNPYGGINFANDFEGIYKGQIRVNPELTMQNYYGTKDKRFTQFQNNEITLSFQIQNLLKNMVFKPNESLYDPQGIAQIDWLSNETINEFLFGNDKANYLNAGATPTEVQLQTIKKTLLTKLVKYNYQQDSFVSNDYGKNIFVLTNALDFQMLNNMTTISSQDFQYDLATGNIFVNIQFNFTNGILNGIAGTTPSLPISLKISGFKKEGVIKKYSITPSTTLKGVLDINEFNKQSQILVNDIHKINRNWILDNLITFNSSIAPIGFNLFATTATREEFELEMLYQKPTNESGFEIKIANNFSYVDVAMYVKLSSLTSTPSVPFSSDYKVYHFQIKGFPTKFEFKYKNEFDIKQAANSISSKLDSLDKVQIIDKLFNFSDQVNSQYIFSTNFSKEEYMTKVFQDLIIEKNYSNHRANLILKHPDTQIKIMLTNFDSEILFDISQNIYVSNKNFNLVEANSEYIINNFMNFENTNTNVNSILNTNVSREEFQSDILGYINIISKDFISNQINIELFFARKINGISGFKASIFFNKDTTNIFNINNNFNIALDNLVPNNFVTENIFDYISFNNSLSYKNSIFSINLSKEEFRLLVTKVTATPNTKNGSINFVFDLSKPMNIDNVQKSYVLNATKLSINVFGFKSRAQANFQSTINANAYAIFDNINSLNQVIDNNFIFDNLIGYNGANGIIGSTNLSKQEFIDMVNIDSNINNKNLIINFNFKSKINDNQNIISTKISNLTFLGHSSVNNYPLWIIIGISTVATLGLIAVIWMWVYNYLKRKKTMEIHKATINNKIK